MYYKKNNLSAAVTGGQDDDDDDAESLSGSEDSSESDDDDDDDESEKERLKSRQPKFFFENAEKKTMSFFKCVLFEHFDKLGVPDSDFLSYLSKLPSPEFSPKWAILMLGGGHFAGAVFEGSNAVVHKTFHCYTVRAKQGGSQSSADNKSGTNHPKSAGASLRRYNQVKNYHA